MHLITLSMPMNADLTLFALRLGLFLVFVYEGWSKLADLKEYSKKMPGEYRSPSRREKESSSDRWAS